MTDAKTATDRLRELLDERGVEWTNPNSCLRDEMTSWVANGFDYEAFEVLDGTLLLTAAHQDDLTPEQAIAATLGSEACVIESTRYIESDMPDSWYEFDLSCGHTVKSAQVPPNYCEECGKKIDLQGVSYV